MHREQPARTSKMWLAVIVVVAVCLGPVRNSLAIDPKPTTAVAQWAGETWGELIIKPAVIKAGNSFTARAVVRGGPAGNPSWHCSQYSGWVAAGTNTIAIVIPEEWSFVSGDGYIRSIGGRAMVQESSAGDPPPYGWEDRLSDTCYCSVDTWGASGGCETREVVPTFASTMQEEILPTGPSGQWLRVTAEFYGWNGVGYSDKAVAYVMVVDETVDLEDNDGDGIPDYWEIAYFGDLSTASKTSSYDDGDGVSDLEENQRWNSNTLDDNGEQYDPTANNSKTSSSGAPSSPGCGAAGPVTVLGGLFSLSLLRFASRRRRRV